MSALRPCIVVLSGPNGAGKTTCAERLLRDTLAVDEFVNVDWIARGLSGFSPERAAMAAGRHMLRRLRELASARQSFAFETTLASKTFAPWLRGRKASGYEVRLVHLSLPNPEVAVQRVRGRVQEGGHDVPEEIVRRRYQRGLRNFFELYAPLATGWQMHDSSTPDLLLIARGGADLPLEVLDSLRWRQVLHAAAHPS
jgi:predicted ABC-type ATPase